MDSDLSIDELREKLEATAWIAIRDSVDSLITTGVNPLLIIKRCVNYVINHHTKEEA